MGLDVSQAVISWVDLLFHNKIKLMINLNKRAYPWEYVIGAVECLLLFVDRKHHLIVNAILIMLLTLKYKKEGFRVTIFAFGAGKLLSLLTGY